jgi:hypothetical protein
MACAALLSKPSCECGGSGTNTKVSRRRATSTKARATWAANPPAWFGTVPLPEGAGMSEPDAEPLGPHKIGEPNKAPSCEDICGDAEHCKREPSEVCSDDAAILKAWKQAASNVATAIDALTNDPSSGPVLQTLKDNFNWSPGQKPTDLPQQVLKNLNDAFGKMSENLCTKCRDCPKGAVAQIARARGKNCTNSNCFVLCPDFFTSSAALQTHALFHELMHRIVNPVQDLYREQSGYPGPPSMALKLPDAYASLLDDLASGKGSQPKPPTSPDAAPKGQSEETAADLGGGTGTVAVA